MKTIEQLKDLAKELNSNPDYEILRFKVMNNKYGTGIRFIGAWSGGGGYVFSTKTTFPYDGLYQGFGRTDEEFVAELKKDVTEIIENLVKDYKEKPDYGLHNPKFVAVMESFLKKTNTH